MAKEKRDSHDVAIAKAMLALIGDGKAFESITISVGGENVTVDKSNRQQLTAKCNDVISGKRTMKG